jgi:HEPN domain-containing protein
MNIKFKIDGLGAGAEESSLLSPTKSSDPNQHLYARDHLQRANEFLQAFKALPEGVPPSWPRYFLLCHAIELALKAFLLSRRWTRQTLKRTKYGHELKKLLGEAKSEGLQLSASAVDDIEALDEAHKNFWPRYPMEESKPVFIIDPFEPAATELIQTLANLLCVGFLRGVDPADHAPPT